MPPRALPRLSRALMEEARFRGRPDLELPGANAFDLPVRAFQIGLGGYIRGHADLFVDGSIRAGAFPGRIAAIQPNSAEMPARLREQDHLYTVVSVGGTEERPEFRYRVVGSLAWTGAARERWDEALSHADGELDLVLTVVTENGVRPDPDDRPDPGGMPRSAMGKLTAFLHRRWSRRPEAPLAVLDSDNVPENGEQVHGAVLETARAWRLEDRFLDWLGNRVSFPVTLADRMVPGFPRDPAAAQRHWETLGYRDEAMVLAEPFHLWVVEDRFAGPRPALEAGGVRYVSDARAYERMKITIINGAHTGMVHAAFLMGVAYVRDAVAHPLLRAHVEHFLFREVAPHFEIAGEDPVRYAREALVRFANPHLDHTTYQICAGGSAKVRSRLIPSLVRYQERTGTVPAHLSFSIAALLRYLTPIGRGRAPDAKGAEREGVLGQRDDGGVYLIEDPRADLLEALPLGSASDPRETTPLLDRILGDRALWGMDLHSLPGSAEAIRRWYARMRSGRMDTALKELLREGAT